MRKSQVEEFYNPRKIARVSQGDYRSVIVWEAMCELSCSPIASSIVGVHERLMRSIRGKRAIHLFETSLYVFEPAWGAVVQCAVDAIARRHRWTESTRQSDWYELEQWLYHCTHGDDYAHYAPKEASDVHDDFAESYWAIRHARKWKDEHPGTRAVAVACEFSRPAASALRRWFESLALSGC